MNDLQTLLQTLLQKYGTKTALARALAISLERLIKVMKDPKESLGVLNCLRLAEISGLSPPQVLRLANKDALAKALEQHYGRKSDGPTSRESAIAVWWPNLSGKGAEALKVFLDEADAARQPAKRRKRRRV